MKGVILGAIIGAVVVIGATVVVMGPTETADVACNGQLDGQGWEATNVTTDTGNKSVEVTCERDGETATILTDANVVEIETAYNSP